MINAQQIHDALTLLPEDLLTPVDALRRRKRFIWKPMAALAACMALVVGLWFLFPGAMSADNAGAAPENGSGDGSVGAITDQITQESASGTGVLSATVAEVAEDYITVLPGNTLADVSGPLTVLLEELEDVPTLEKGQSVTLYCKDLSDLSKPLVPYRIEVTEDEKEDKK